MIHYVSGNIFDSPAQTLVNPVNTVGVMGKGLALEFRRRYPNMFDEYKKQCRDGWLHVGDLMLWRAKDHFVLNFPTKKHWKDPSSLIYVEAGLLSFVMAFHLLHFQSLDVVMEDWIGKLLSQLWSDICKSCQLMSIFIFE